MGNTIDITPFAVGLLSLIALFISGFLVPMIKSKTTKNQQETIRIIASTVVYAAEQLFGTERGKDKLAYATAQMKTWLAKLGIRIDTSALRPYIEAAVKELSFMEDSEEIPDAQIPCLGEFIRSDDENPTDEQ